MDLPFLCHFISLTVFSLMLTIGLTHPFGQLISLSLWRQPEVLIRSLLVVIVLVTPDKGRTVEPATGRNFQNGEKRLLVLNHVARSVIVELRAERAEDCDADRIGYVYVSGAACRKDE